MRDRHHFPFGPMERPLRGMPTSSFFLNRSTCQKRGVGLKSTVKKHLPDVLPENASGRQNHLDGFHRVHHGQNIESKADSLWVAITGVPETTGAPGTTTGAS